LEGLRKFFSAQLGETKPRQLIVARLQADKERLSGEVASLRQQLRIEQERGAQHSAEILRLKKRTDSLPPLEGTA